MEITGVPQQLAEFMIQISKHKYASSWCLFLEYELWKEITEDLDVLTEGEAEKLQNYVEATGGWIQMNNETDQLEFVLLDHWKKIYERNKPF